MQTLGGRGVRFVGPIDGPLAHGDEGMGRLSEPVDIVTAVASAAAALEGGASSARAARSLAGRHVLIAAGPTHEPIDPVRFLGNRSSGKMGAAIAAEALAAGCAGDGRARSRRRATARRRGGRRRRDRRGDARRRHRPCRRRRRDRDGRRGRGLPSEARGRPQAQEGRRRPGAPARADPRHPRRAGGAAAPGPAPRRVRGGDRTTSRPPAETSSPARASTSSWPTWSAEPTRASAPTRTRRRSSRRDGEDVGVATVDEDGARRRAVGPDRRAARAHGGPVSRPDGVCRRR